MSNHMMVKLVNPSPPFVGLKLWDDKLVDKVVRDAAVKSKDSYSRSPTTKQLGGQLHLSLVGIGEGSEHEAVPRINKGWEMERCM